MHLRTLILLLASFLAVNSARSQTPPQHEELLRFWFESQLQALSRADTVYFEEAVKWKIDAPFGSPTMEIHSSVRSLPYRSLRWTRTRQAFVNDKPVPRPRLNEVKERWHTNTRKQIEEMLEETEIRPALMEKMRPAGAVKSEKLDGREAWRVEVIRRDRKLPVERISFWFEQSTNRLIRSRSIINPGPDSPNFVITTEYVNEMQLDRPRHRMVEGNVTIKRRSRYYTVLISYEADITDFRIQQYRSSD